MGHVVQFGMQTFYLCLADAEFAVEERPDVHIGLQIVHLKHLALLAVLDAEPIEFGIKRPQVDADTVDLDVGL